MLSSSIVSLDVEVFALELSEPFGIAGGSPDLARIAVVQLRLADGTLGLGEAAPLTAYNGERIEDALAAVEAARPLLVGRDARGWRRPTPRSARRGSISIVRRRCSSARA